MQLTLSAPLLKALSSFAQTVGSVWNEVLCLWRGAEEHAVQTPPSRTAVLCLTLHGDTWSEIREAWQSGPDDLPLPCMREKPVAPSQIHMNTTSTHKQSQPAPSSFALPPSTTKMQEVGHCCCLTADHQGSPYSPQGLSEVNTTRKFTLEPLSQLKWENL